MSQIFDALQKSARERSGTEIGSVAATELIQAAERSIAAERRAATGGKSPIESQLPSSAPAFKRRQTTLNEALVPAVDQLPGAEAAPDTLGQFQSLIAAVPSHSPLVSLNAKESLAAEKFRFLGVRLRQMQQSRQLKKVLITSTIPQEGKSVVAANLACVLAFRPQQKTLLLEGDLRRPSLGELFGLPGVPGICEYLQGDRELTASVYSVEGHNLWVFPAGTPPRNPLELMQSGRLSAMMDGLASWFDWIVIDSPPVLPLGDTSIWMRLADGVLLVVRHGTTEKEQLQRGLETIESEKLLGALLNGSTRTSRSHYYYTYSGAPQSTKSPQN
jgi:capsular exopolysaccharide synthesis family protein